MSKSYKCENCNEVYNKKKDLDNHKKTCMSETKLSNENKTDIVTIFKNCLDALRSEGLTGIKAIKNMSYLIVLKLIESHLGNEIKIDEYEYDFSDYDFGDNEKEVQKVKKKLLEIARFSNLAKENKEKLKGNIKHLWDDILSVHPTTKTIFKKENGFEFKYDTTYEKLISNINKLPDTDFDILGNSYEEFLQYGSLGKDLGQFFTQPVVKNLMINLIEPKIHPDGKIDTCGDPTMGTGGFLISYLKEILKQAKERDIKPDWDFIKNDGLYGKEIETDTYSLAVANMLISSGHMFSNLDEGDSIREPIDKKFDNILSNPPFGIKIKYDDFVIEQGLKLKYIPIKVNRAVSLFIQAIIHMLKIDGKCAVVLPDGEDLFSKTDKALVAVREYLMKTCDLQKIIYLPSGVFTNTTIKTCVFFFIKKKEGSGIMDVEIKISKS